MDANFLNYTLPQLNLNPFTAQYNLSQIHNNIQNWTYISPNQKGEGSRISCIVSVIALRKIASFTASFCKYILTPPEHGKIPSRHVFCNVFADDSFALVRIIFFRIFHFFFKDIFRWKWYIGCLQLFFQFLVFCLKFSYHIPKWIQVMCFDIHLFLLNVLKSHSLIFALRFMRLSLEIWYCQVRNSFFILSKSTASSVPHKL